MLDVITSKVLSLVLLFVSTSLFGLAPILVVKKILTSPRELLAVTERQIHSRQAAVISVLLCFGGGVLLSTFMVHMVPEVRESFNKGLSAHDLDHYRHVPLTEIVVCLGFFIVYFIEELLNIVIGHEHCHTHVHGVGHSHSPAVVTCEDDQNANDSKYDDHLDEQDAESDDGEEAKLRTSPKRKSNYGSSTTERNGPKPTQAASGIKGLIIIVALSIHAVFEGMAIGLQNSVKHVWMLFVGMLFHKLVLAFCVGLETFLHGVSQKTVILYMLVFASMSPIGVIVGTVTDVALVDSFLSIATLQSLAAGTLMYVTFFEIFMPEKNNKQSGILKLSSAVVGFALMSCLSFME
ncbi:SLC39A3 (predicted) [Pycnogonum litorale]